MKMTWQGTVTAATCASLMIIASVASTQERPAAPAAAPPKAPAKAPVDLIHVNACHVNLIDKITLAASRAGVLALVKPEEGHEIKLGEMVAKVRDEVAKAQFATADKTASSTVEIRFAEKSAELAQQEYIKGLQSNALLPGTVTDIEMKRLKLAWEKAVLQIESAQKEHEVAASKRDEAGELLQTHVVETTIGGMVTKVHKRTGEGVREGDPIIDIVNTDRMRVQGYVPFKDISRVRVGDKVLVKLDVPNIQLPEEDQRFEGRITFIDVTVTKVTNPEVRVYAEVVNRDGILRDGAVAEMVIYPNQALAPPNAQAFAPNGVPPRAFPKKPAAD